MNWYMDVLKKYAVFSGRARRKEYWMFFLFTMIIAIALGIVDGLVGTVIDSGNGRSMGIISNIYQLAVAIPSIAVGIRRMHDTNHSGWWLFVPIANFIFAVSDGTKGDNQYGADPKAGA